MLDRSARYTIKTKQLELYSDFLINFDLNPITGFIARVTNEDSVKQSLKTLILTRRGERFYDSVAGSRVYSLLFELLDTVTIDKIKSEILETIKNNEPRVQHASVDVIPSADENSVNVKVFYDVINIPNQTFTLNLILERVR